MTKTVGIFLGSLRKGSYSRIIAQELAKLFPADYTTQFLEIGNLPLYNQDFDDLGPVPAEYVQFRAAVQKLDAALFVTPEYNRSVPAVLKNALDVASRPYGANVWEDLVLIIICAKRSFFLICQPCNNPKLISVMWINLSILLRARLTIKVRKIFCSQLLTPLFN